jgi:hypothetical protein
MQKLGYLSKLLLYLYLTGWKNVLTMRELKGWLAEGRQSNVCKFMQIS